jgi:hypothetical protein
MPMVMTGGGGVVRDMHRVLFQRLGVKADEVCVAFAQSTEKRFAIRGFRIK